MSNELTFLLLVFGAVLFMSQTLFVSVYNPQRSKTKQLKKHLEELAIKDPHQVDLVLNQRLSKLNPIFIEIEKIGFVEGLSYKLEMSGSKLFGHQYILLMVLVSVIVAPLVWNLTLDPFFILISVFLVIGVFQLKLKRDIANRLEKIETQFPESLDVLKRGLQAGYAFSEALKLVCEETEGELAVEFDLMFKQINFGNDIKTALLTFVHRVPTTSAMAFASAVSIQKETGGNLAEKIETLSRVIRQRFKFQRRVKTLSAEGRLSAWVLVLTPFALFAFLYMSSPDYVSELFTSPEGISLLKWGGLGMVVGTIWISKLINIEY
ncbi:type II secretion system F family protein [Thalassotalea psychrophila]|uniref:Type II secretion system F family protein n=1 Tax=Thalassotalea psychrophila TaxID=3065647 RepID=A0ABY9TXS5_9GAMM|nr:type II secretion system F family protein [Colwelliaceae bacterium SQ149]